MRRYFWLLLPLLVIPAARLLLGADWLYFLGWWLALALPGWLAWPLTARFFPYGDRGYLLAKPLGLALSALSLWTLSYLRILPFRNWSVSLVLCVLGLLSFLVRDGWKQLRDNRAGQDLVRGAACGEALFAAALLFWTFARGLKPELDSLEKFMDVGFLNTLWRTDWLPAADIWLAGGSINYYYFGQYVYAFIAKLTGIRPEISYNLAMAATLAFTLTLSYAAGSQLFGLARRLDPRLPAGAQTAGGLLSAVLVSFAGNGHSFWFDAASPGHRLALWLQERALIGGDLRKAFWFADSTRFIGYNPDTSDKTIHEFPYYSFLVADLHAHVVNLAFVLLLLALLVCLIEQAPLREAANDCRQWQERLQDSDDRTWHRIGLRQVVRRFQITAGNLPLLLTGLLLAIFMMGNYWDFAIYFLLASLVLLLVNSRGYGRIGRPSSILVFLFQCGLLLIPYLLISNPLVSVLVFAVVLAANHYLTLIWGDALSLTGAQMSWLFLIAHLITLPFNHAFEPISKSIALSVNHTPVWQLLVLWGPFLLAGLLLLLYLLAWGQPGKLRRVFPAAAGSQEATEMPRGWLIRFLRLQNPADLLACCFLTVAVGLILAPELVYVVDIYSGDYKRANTMFKFTYQAFVLFSLVWAYATVRVLATRSKSRPAAAPNRSSRQASIRLPGRAYRPAPNWPAWLIGLPLVILLLLPFWYPFAATRQWLGAFKLQNYRGIDGLEVLATKDSAQIDGNAAGELAADYAAIRWLNAHVQNQPVILEASGDSYTDYCRISAFTGLPTVIGWQTHEWLWRTGRSTPDAYGSVVSPRQADVLTLYTTTDQVRRQELLKKYQVAYIIIGDLERTKYSEILSDGSRHVLVQEDLLSELGQIVFQEGTLLMIKIAG